VKNYVIRVYRQDREDINKVVGIVEDIEEDLQDSFSSLGELVRILCGKQKIIGEITKEEVQDMIWCCLGEKEHSGKNLNLADLREPYGESKKE